MPSATSKGDASAFQRFARFFLAVRELDFLLVGVTLVATLVVYQVLPAMGGLLGSHSAFDAMGPLGVLGITLLLGFFGLPLAAGVYAAVRPGELRGVLLRVVEVSTLLVQVIVGFLVATLTFLYTSFLLAYPEVAGFFGLPSAAPPLLELQRLLAVYVAARAGLTLVLLLLHRGSTYVHGDTSPVAAIVCSGVALATVVVARLTGQLSSFAMVDAWTAAGIASLFFRGPSQEV